MKTKKLMVVLMAVAMILTFSVSAFAFSDTDKLSEVQKNSIDKLAALDILHGYADGTFQAEGKITRAEFTKIAMTAAGLADSADILAATPTKFKDAKVNVWYTGWVNLAQAKNYILGYPDGTFRPNDTITQQEAITVLLRILGYNNNLTGPWPVSYVTQAVKLGILDDVKFTGNTPATRGDIAVITDATLGQKTVSWSKDSESFSENKTTLMEESFKGNTIKDAQVDGIGNALGGIDVADAAKNTFKLQMTDSANKAVSMELSDKFAISGGKGLFDLAGAKVNIIYEKGSKKDVIKYIEVTSTTKDVEKAVVGTKNKVTLDGKDFNAVTGLVIPTNQENGVRAYLNADGYVYALVSLKNMVAPNPALIKAVNESTGRIEVLAGSTPASFKNKDVVVVKNGKVAKLGDIKKNDVIYVYAGVGDADFLYMVESVKEGKLERRYGSGASAVLAIDGMKYGVSDRGVFAEGNDNYNGTLNTIKSDLIGQSGIYAINKQNQVIFMGFGITAESSNMLGIVLDYTTSNSAVSNGEVDTMTIVNEKGNTVTYKVKAGTFVAANVKAGQVVKFRTDDSNVINKNIALTLNTNATSSADIDTSKNYLTLNTTSNAANAMKYVVNDNTLIFNIKLVDGKIQAETLSKKDIMTGSKLTGTAIAGKYPVEALRYSVNGLDIEVLVIAQFGATDSGRFGVLEDIGITDGNVTNAIKFYGDSKLYEVATGVSTAKKVGNVYNYEVTGTTITAMTLVYDGTTVTPGSGNASLTGQVTGMNNKLFQVTKADQSRWNFVMESDTTILDFTGNTPTVVEQISTGDDIIVVTDKTEKVILVIIK